MRDEILYEIDQCLSGLPVLEQQKIRLTARLSASETQINRLQERYEKNEGDLKKLKKEEFSSALKRLYRYFGGKKTAQMQTLLATKLEYQKEMTHFADLKKELADLSRKIDELSKKKVGYEKSLREKEAEIASCQDSGLFEQYMLLQEKSQVIAAQIMATELTLHELEIVKSFASEALIVLESMEEVTIGRGRSDGLVGQSSSEFKRMDHAQKIFNRLVSGMKDLERELEAVHLTEPLVLLSISSANQMVSFWFDNVYTDEKTRKILMDNQVQLRVFLRQLDQLAGILQKNAKEKKKELTKFEKNRERLLTDCVV